MDTATVDKWIQGVAEERVRTAIPEGFPDLPDIPARRYSDPDFFCRSGRRCGAAPGFTPDISISFASPGAFSSIPQSEPRTDRKVSASRRSLVKIEDD